jgi:hypothetical protein
LERERQDKGMAQDEEPEFSAQLNAVIAPA